MSFNGIFAIGVSGVTAYAASLEAVAQNIANSQTIGFKRARTDFADLVTAHAPQSRQRLGTGVDAAHRLLVSEQGGLTRTETKTNIAVSGAGFLVVSDDVAGSAPFLFTRAGDFAPNVAGELVNGANYRLQGFPLGASGAPVANGGLAGLETVNINRPPPGVTDPGALAGVEIDEDGRVLASYANGETYALYQIPLALFTNEQGLAEGSATAFLQSTAAGSLRLVAPGESRSGLLEGAAIETSTVDIGQEFSTLIETQRAYATNARIISVADELWSRLVETAA